MTNIRIYIFVLLTGFLVACTKDNMEIEGCTDPAAINYNKDANTNTQCTYPVEMSQGQLNAINNVVADSITGAFDSSINFPHNGTSLLGNSSVRDIYASINASTSVKTGTIIAKKVYARDTLTGARGALQACFVMIKQPEGYFKDGGDWEYVMIPYNAAVNYTQNPYGQLPAVNTPDVRGKLTYCSSCHVKASGSDFLFYR